MLNENVYIIVLIILGTIPTETGRLSSLHELQQHENSFAGAYGSWYNFYIVF